MKCPMCFGIGWVLDANGAGMVPPLSLELIECFYPECPASGPELVSVVFKGPRFRHAARHPSDGYLMSVSA